MALRGPKKARRSTATNAYDLLTDVRRYNCEEPTRLWMDHWQLERGFPDYDDLLGRTQKQGPACGTIGCIAGNIGVLTETSWSSAGRMLCSGPITDVLSNQQLAIDINRLFLGTSVRAAYGTPEYVAIVNLRIAKFQEKHEVALKATPVTPPQAPARKKKETPGR